MRRILPCTLLFLLVGIGCTTAKPYNYGPLMDHMPASILVLPPLNESPEAVVAPVWLSTITVPLAERGYYVFPVGLVHRILRENGLPTAHEMHQVSLRKLNEVFGPDAVLYVTIRDWGTSYEVLSSNTRVTVSARLVDVATGAEIWQGRAAAVRSSNSGNQNGIIGALVGALVNQVVTSAFDPTPEVSRGANILLLNNAHRGLLEGPLHPQHEERMLRERELQQNR